MDAILLVLQVLAAIIGPAGPPPRACPVGTEFWRVFELAEVRILADNSYQGLDNPDMADYIAKEGCFDGTIVQETIKQSQDEGIRLFVAMEDQIFEMVDQ